MVLGSVLKVDREHNGARVRVLARVDEPGAGAVVVRHYAALAAAVALHGDDTAALLARRRGRRPCAVERGVDGRLGIIVLLATKKNLCTKNFKQSSLAGHWARDCVLKKNSRCSRPKCIEIASVRHRCALAGQARAHSSLKAATKMQEHMYIALREDRAAPHAPWST